MDLNNKKPTLLKTFDMLGRETKPKPGGFYIYLYSDGSIERKMEME